MKIGGTATRRPVIGITCPKLELRTKVVLWREWALETLYS
jgi:hypothetical protein